MGAANGVVDLWTGGLMTGQEARPTLTTRQIADPYVENARHGDVDKLLAHLEQWERDWLLSAFGHALYGEPNERIYYLLGEAGGEGKSTVLTAIRSALAEYGGELLDGALTEQRRGGSAGLTPELGILKTARIVVKSGNMTGELDEERIKAVSGGDPIAHRDLYQSQSSLTRVVGTLFFAVNELPRMRLEKTGPWHEGSKSFDIPRLRQSMLAYGNAFGTVVNSGRRWWAYWFGVPSRIRSRPAMSPR